MKRVAIIIPSMYQPQSRSVLECLDSLDKEAKQTKDALEQKFIPNRQQATKNGS